MHPFQAALVKAREMSRYPTQESFALQAGLSVGGYIKYEQGYRIPSVRALGLMIFNCGIDDRTAEKLRSLRDDARSIQAGLGPQCQTQAVDCDALARRIRTETIFVLKQAGCWAGSKATEGVMEKRIAMILKSVLEG